MLDFLQDVILVTGHYGSGKTNLAVNLALAFRAAGETVTLVDLDIVNPYFRTADFADLMHQHGIGLITPAYAGSSVDVPALTGALDARLGAPGRLIVDVGGDDAGAYALGRYAPAIEARPYTMLYVVNRYRYLTREPAEAVQLLRDIETASRLKATHIVNNSNLAEETTAKEALAGVGFAQEVAKLTSKEYAFTSVARPLAAQLEVQTPCFAVDRLVKTLWG